MFLTNQFLDEYVSQKKWDQREKYRERNNKTISEPSI